MNVKLLKEIRRQILKEPSRLNMGRWMTMQCGSTCGTAGCIAGWAYAIDKAENKPKVQEEFADICTAWLTDYGEGGDLSSEGLDLLDIDGAQGSRLFYTNHWPKKFRVAYDEGSNLISYGQTHEEIKKGQCMRARATAERIMFFIETGGTDVIATTEEPTTKGQ